MRHHAEYTARTRHRDDATDGRQAAPRDETVTDEVQYWKKRKILEDEIGDNNEQSDETRQLDIFNLVKQKMLQEYF